jgi:hypothetical protein
MIRMLVSIALLIFSPALAGESAEEPQYEMGDDTALRGILVFRTVERDRVLELVARDPSVKARRLEVELYEWRLFKGTLPPASAR